MLLYLYIRKEAIGRPVKTKDMKTTVKVLGFTTEGLTFVELSNGQYDAIVLYNETTLEIECEIEFVDYLSMNKTEANNDQLGSVSVGLVKDWFETLVGSL